MLFRSEGEIETWRGQQRKSQGAVLRLAQVWDLAQRWYADRLSPDFRGWTARQAAVIFRDLGLRGQFWEVG